MRQNVISNMMWKEVILKDLQVLTINMNLVSMLNGNKRLT